MYVCMYVYIYFIKKMSETKRKTKKLHLKQAKVVHYI